MSPARPPEGARKPPPPAALPVAPAFVFGPRLLRTVAASHVLQPGEPPVRRLRIFTSDPVASRMEGHTAVAHVPYEPLKVLEADGQRPPCVCGAVFELLMVDADGRFLDPPRFDEPHQLIEDGYAPSEANPRFHAQMVYAVAVKVHASFQRALGREPGWAFGREHARLRIHPLGSGEANAWYDANAGELRFGYSDRPAAGGWVFTSLSHDIIAHELAHALLDSQRPAFMEPSSSDVPGFHEGFADLVALFQHFQYPEAVRSALQKSRGVLVARHDEETAADWLCCLARQFGQADGLDALRRADRPPKRKGETRQDALSYSACLEEHDMGEVLLSAVFDAYDTVFRRRTARLRRLASGGTGELPRGELSADLLDALAAEAASLASKFVALVVRALDYCPPADIRLGEFLRAMVTADRALVPDDRWAFREALIDAFRVRQIVPSHVLSLSEDSLVWGPPRLPLPVLARLSFAQIRFATEPGRPVSVEERLAQAQALGEWLSEPHALAECGLVTADDPRLAEHGARVGPPCIESIEVARRVGPGGEVRFETIAVVTQTCTVPRRGTARGFSFTGGGTLVFGPTGDLLFAITKSVAGEGRIDRRRDFITAASGVAPRYWEEREGVMQPRALWTRELHARARRADANGDREEAVAATPLMRAAP